jgi:hypothetical protein
MKHYQIKENYKKKCNAHLKNFLLFDMVVIFSYIYIYSENKCKKTHFLNEISSKNINFVNGLDLIDVYQFIHHKKIHSRIPLMILVLKYKCKISNFVMNIILLEIYFICSSISMFVGFLKKLIRFSLKLIKYT